MPDGAQPYFFLSYANANDDQADAKMVEFYDLLCSHLRQLTTIDAGTPPGYIARQMPPGTVWHPRLFSALSTCQVFVPLYSRRYFESQWCGWEWEAFQRRENENRRDGAYTYSAIVPILWTEAAGLRLPACAARLQYVDRTLGDLYRQVGVYGLMFQDEPQYQKVAYWIARTIRDVAESTRLSPCGTEIFTNITNAFEDNEDKP